jgi:chromosome partitioning protein
VRSIVLANQKGGVGKTTTAIHLAHGIALSGRKVVLVDLDLQGNATVALQGMSSAPSSEPGLSELTAVAQNLWLVPSPGAFGEVPRDAKVDFERLRQLTETLANSIDFLVFDCPPRMDDWGWAGVRLGDEILVPVQAEFFAMHGLSQMLSSIETAAAENPGKAKLRGVLPTMVDYADPVTGEILQDLRRNLGERVLRTTILRDASLVEAASFGTTVFIHSPATKAALCYAQLVKELMHG